MRRWFILTASHLAMLGIGFAAGIYTLPILTAARPPKPAAYQAIVDVPVGIDVRDYNTVVIWCEAFDQFISAAAYRPSRQALK